MDTPDTTPPPKTPMVPKPTPPWKKGLMGFGLLLGVSATLWYFYDLSTHATTDDAYISGHLHEVSSRIVGVVQEVSVEDNQAVHAGDVLARLDPADNQAVYNEAKANFEKAQIDDQRNQELVGTKAISQQDLDHAHTDLEAAQARLDTARLQLSYATIVAPANGRVGRKNIEVGNRVQPGETLLVIVEDDTWVVTNFKETELAKMKPRQKVKLSVDAIPGLSFTGYVDSLAPASGNEFALLPADNSTGNFTKIVQRLPVKIRFNPDSVKGLEDRLHPRLSVEVRVDLEARDD